MRVQGVHIGAALLSLDIRCGWGSLLSPDSILGCLFLRGRAQITVRTSGQRHDTRLKVGTNTADRLPQSNGKQALHVVVSSLDRNGRRLSCGCQYACVRAKPLVHSAVDFVCCIFTHGWDVQFGREVSACVPKGRADGRWGSIQPPVHR